MWKYLHVFMSHCKAGLGQRPLYQLPRVQSNCLNCLLQQLQTQTLYWHNLSSCWNSINLPSIQTTLWLLRHRFFQHSQRETGKEKSCPNLWKFQHQRETENNRSKGARVTHLIDFHELGVGTRPFYGHLDNVCRWRHCKLRSCQNPVELEILQRRQLHVSISNGEWEKEKEKLLSVDARRISLHHFLFSLAV